MRVDRDKLGERRTCQTSKKTTRWASAMTAAVGGRCSIPAFQSTIVVVLASAGVHFPSDTRSSMGDFFQCTSRCFDAVWWGWEGWVSADAESAIINGMLPIGWY